MANAVYTRYLGDISREYIESFRSLGVHGTSWTSVRGRPFDGVGLRHHLEPLIIEEHKLQVRDSIDSTSQPPRLTVTPPPPPSMLTPPILYLKGIYPEFQVIRDFSQKIPAGLLSYDQIHS